ncbi:flagellar biosynthesis protein FlhB [Paenibacillus flagellatus]|uniref:Flagellar biosynthetic protein FlhB n=1 Tax=Paenibacillus flagellatus TaxID=2211139 RepID=A0A2V5JW43_9BACL|nr:flagellar biosynthesis protein FlhB [Paenibacillus flagellatus]PYI50382.1 flagellar biosynthesis protein FlhB [Paenibacillus flagellatus]
MQRFALPLDLQLFAGEKTEKATPKKRQEARQKGQVAKSMELPSALILFGVLLLLFGYGTMMRDKIEDMFVVSFHDYMTMEMTPNNVSLVFGKLIFEGLLLLAPIFGLAMVMAIVASYSQIGFLLTLEPLKMSFSKLDPIKGIGNLFKLRSFIELLKSIMKMTVIGLVVFYTIWSEKEQFIEMGRWPVIHTFSYTAHLILMLGVQIAAILLVLALFDYMYQRYELEKNLRMSKDEIKQEYKNTEGDPLIKSKIREKQRRMAMQRMMQDVPKADVVITNPTHFAVAIRYDPKQAEAPMVVAKGTDYVALKIRQVAEEHGVIRMENKPLARALYAQVEIGQTIPADLFQAVAEVLAYVYKLKGKTSANVK